MTPLEDKVRQAFQAKAGQVRYDVAPPLRLPARRRRFFSLAHGGGQSGGASARRGWLAPAASAVLVAAMIAGSVAVSRGVAGHQRPGPGAVPASDRAAAAWVTAQVSRSVVVSCDPAMCRALRAHGFPADDLLVLGPGGGGPLESQVIVATAAVRRELGARLSSVYAPAVLASFGSGSTRIEVRVIAPGGASGYLAALKADRQARQSAGAALADSSRITATAAARKQMKAGRVAVQLLIMITSLAALRPLDILAFGDSGPGAAADMPLRSVYLTDNGSHAAGRTILTFLHTQQGVLRPARAEITRYAGRADLFIEFAAPTPLGLINGPSAPAHP
jgi:hypothetical protein